MRSTSVALLALALVAAAVAPAVAAVGSSPAAQADDPRPPVEQWNRTYDSPGGEIFSSITKTSGGYLLTGWTDGGEDHDGWILAVDSEGRERWATVVGGSGTDRLYGAVPTADGGFLAVGRTDVDGEARGWLVKVDDGTVEWERTVASRPGGFRAVDRTASEILVGGWTWQDGTAGWLVTVDEEGTVEDEHVYHTGDDARTYVKSLVVDDDGAFLAGRSETDGGQDGWAARVSDNGTAVWSRTYGNGTHDDLWAVAADESGYVLAGETGTAERDGRDAWVLALDGNGTTRWERTYGGEGYDWFDSATATADGLVFTGGTSTGEIGGVDGFVVKTDGDGTERWRTAVGTALWDKPWPAVATDDGGYLLAGHSSGYATDGTAGWLVKLAPADESTPTATATTAGGTPTDQSDAEPDVGMDRFWRPELTALVALAALALGVLVARR